MKKICITNQKGGSGKTSTAVLLTLALAGSRRRVLAVDSDPQAGLTSFFIPEGWTEKRGLYDLIMGDNPEPVHIDRGGIVFDLIPADYRLDKIYSTLAPFAIRDAFKCADYDMIIFDTPPTVQGISRAAAMASDRIIVPTDISRASIRPTIYTLTALKEIEKTGQVYLIGKDPGEDGRGFTAETARTFIEELGRNYAGTIPRSVSMQKIVSDTVRSWSPARIEKQLNPILEAVQI